MNAPQNSLLARCRNDFFTGLAIVMPAVISVAVVVWLFTNVSNLTDTLLFFLPRTLTHQMLPDHREGPIYWYWSCAALLWALLLVTLVGHYGRYYLGRKAIEMTDYAMMHVPLLNKVYGTVKQVNESFTSNKSSFKQVVLVAYPNERARSIGFVTGEQTKLGVGALLSVFVPTTPNPTSGFMLLVPEEDVVKLDMPVAEGIKFVISIGAIAPAMSNSPIPLPEAQIKPPLDRAPAALK